MIFSMVDLSGGSSLLSLDVTAFVMKKTISDCCGRRFRAHLAQFCAHSQHTPVVYSYPRQYTFFLAFLQLLTLPTQIPFTFTYPNSISIIFRHLPKLSRNRFFNIYTQKTTSTTVNTDTELYFEVKSLICFLSVLAGSRLFAALTSDWFHVLFISEIFLSLGLRF